MEFGRMSVSAFTTYPMREDVTRVSRGCGTMVSEMCPLFLSSD